MKCILANPRGFCAGVERAILIVEKSLKKFGKPIFIKHEIVHNNFVVKRLKDMGAVFVEDLSEIPKGSTIIFSAHGVGKNIYKQAEDLQLKIIDATCPLVKAVHRTVQKYADENCFIVLIGHKGHAEIEGTLGQLEQGRINLISFVSDIDKLPQNVENIAYLTQTTLSFEETGKIISELKKRYPNIQGSKNGNLCFATTNRQSAVRSMCSNIDLLLVVGSQNSSNSRRLRDVGEECGVHSLLIDSVDDLNEKLFKGVKTVGISSGASAPENLVQDVLIWLNGRFNIEQINEEKITDETVKFSLPKVLED